MKIEGRRIITFKIKKTDKYVLYLADTERKTDDGYAKTEIEIVPANIDRIAGLVTNDKYAFVGFGNKYDDNIILNYIIRNKDLLRNAGQKSITELIEKTKENVLEKQDKDLERQYKYVNLFNSFDLQRFMFSKSEAVTLDAFVKSSDFRYSDGSHDVDNIANILEDIKARIDARTKIEEIYNEDLFDACEGVIGARLIKSLYARKNGVRQSDLASGQSKSTTVRMSDIILPKVRFSTEQMKMFLEDFSKESICVNDSWYRYVAMGKYEFGMNLAGLRLNTDPVKIESDGEGEVCNIDVSSFWPSIAVAYGIRPSHINDSFIDIFRDMLFKRLEFKKTDKACSDAMKLMLNGIIGQFMIEGSWLYDPEASMKIRINGALFMLMLAERLYDEVDIKCVTIDGMFVKSKRNGSMKSIRDIVDGWSIDTGLRADITEYGKVYMLSNNDYIADSTTKGFFSYQGNNGRNMVPDIIRIAVTENLVNGTPIDVTVRNHDKVCDYFASTISEDVLEWKGETFKSARYYYSDENRIGKIRISDFQATTTVPVTEYGVTITDELPPEIPENINYQYYISEANRIADKIKVQQLTLFQ